MLRNIFSSPSIALRSYFKTKKFTPEMSQKFITSFFKPNATKVEEEPIQPTKCRVKRLRIDSSSDEENCKKKSNISTGDDLNAEQSKNVKTVENSSASCCTKSNAESDTLSQETKVFEDENSAYNNESSNEKQLSTSSNLEHELKINEENESYSPVKSNEKIKSGKSVSSKQKVFIGMQQSLQSSYKKDEVKYNPAKENYDSVKDAFWNKGEKTPYLALARTFQLIEETRGRIKMIDILSNYFTSVITLNPDDLLPSVYLSINQVAPAYEGLELGIAEHTLMKVICKATGRDMNHIKSQTHKTGDLGIVAEQSRIAQPMMFRPAPLTVHGLFNKVRTIAKTTGPSKLNLIQDIYVACRYSEARFFIRSLIGKLRIGVAEQSLMQALATALVKKYKKPSSATFKKHVDDKFLILRTAFSQCPNYDKIIPTLLEYDIAELLTRCPMEPGVPLKPMLALPTKSIGEVLERFENLHITCEWKYDGERAQIHCDEKGNVRIYSRNQEDNTSKYPDVIQRISNFVKSGVTSFIVDSEIVAWDVERQQILPFQVLSTRKRKGVAMEDIKVQVCVYAFDLLYVDGKPLVTEQFIERRRLLKSNFDEVKGEWQFATSLDTTDVDEIQSFLDESIKGNCEGLMVKTLQSDATYEIAKRSRNWLKLKKDYLSSCGDSLDLVVIGGYKGRGKRTGIYGGFLLACFDAENEEYQTICKIGTGFSEEDLRVHADFFKEHVLTEPKSYFSFDNSLAPDDWFEPVQIWEVKCADLSLSPVHRAAIGIADPERGISLRFPRFVRIRPDKSVENATSAQQVACMYSSQDQIKNQQDGSKPSNDYYNDFY